MSTKITIAIDGFSSTGKSTVAKELAKKLLLLINDKNLYNKISKNNLQKSKIHSVKNYTNTMLETYNNLLKNNYY